MQDNSAITQAERVALFALKKTRASKRKNCARQWRNHTSRPDRAVFIGEKRALPFIGQICSLVEL